MAHFAKLDNNNLVLEVNCLDNKELLIDGMELEVKGIEFLVSWSGGYANWKQTSYNTRGGQHPEGRPLRKNYAGIGFTYDPVRDAFIPPQPYPSWLLDETTCLWGPPVPAPNDGSLYNWDEATTSWVAVTL